jgi:hypothetical protein
MGMRNVVKNASLQAENDSINQSRSQQMEGKSRPPTVIIASDTYIGVLNGH